MISPLPPTTLNPIWELEDKSTSKEEGEAVVVLYDTAKSVWASTAGSTVTETTAVLAADTNLMATRISLISKSSNTLVLTDGSQLPDGGGQYIIIR